MLDLPTDALPVSSYSARQPHDYLRLTFYLQLEQLGLELSVQHLFTQTPWGARTLQELVTTL